MPGCFLPQGLCICSSWHLECYPPRYLHDLLPHYLQVSVQIPPYQQKIGINSLFKKEGDREREREEGKEGKERKKRREGKRGRKKMIPKHIKRCQPHSKEENDILKYHGDTILPIQLTRIQKLNNVLCGWDCGGTGSVEGKFAIGDCFNTVYNSKGGETMQVSLI